ncbi:MAG: TrkA family potassium uptake protein [Clostridia bacterium]
MRMVIAGGGKIGKNLARAMIEKRYEVSLIERDRLKCLRLADELDAQIICGDSSNVSTLESAGVKNCECFMAVTGSDQDNIVASQLAKNYFHAKKVIARASNPRNLETFHLLGVDFAVSSTEIITKLIEQEANIDKMHLLASLSKGKGAICTMKLPQKTVYDEVALKDLKFPKGMLVVSIVRDDDMIIPNGSTILKKGDEVVAVCKEKYQRTLTKLLSEEK